jgi:hypothetical protein
VQVEQQMSSGGWEECKQLNELGQQYILNEDHGSDGTFALKARPSPHLCPGYLSVL